MNKRNKRAGVPKKRFIPKRSTLISVGMIVIAITAVVVLAMFSKPEKDEPQKTVRRTNVNVMEVQRLSQLEDAAILSGNVEPECTVKVAAEVSGRVEQMICKEGRACEKGQEMIVINSDLLRAELERTKAAVELAEAQISRAQAQVEIDRYELESVRKLHQRDAATDFALKQAQNKLTVSQSGLSEARAALAQNKAALQTVKTKLDHTRIVAPIGGQLDCTFVEAGEYVSPGKVVARIVNVREVRVVVDVPEQDIQYIQPGSKHEVFLNVDDSADPITAEVDYISQTADPSARTTRVELLVDNRDRRLHSGQIVRVRMRRRNVSNAIMIPLAAVISMEDGRCVYVVEDGKAQRRNIELGFFRGQSVRVEKGLEGGEKLIVSGHRYVGPNQDVQIVQTVTDDADLQWTAKPQR